ncbi:MAG: 6-phosphofructokinase [Calditrichaeota bacterium]|nr:6-phosphofructokinase [Calditrichota bacterium]
MKRIAVLTSGGDAPGMNACIRAVVRTALKHDMTVWGVRRGYVGLCNGEFIPMDSRSVSNIIQFGGTVIETSRCPEFYEKEGRARAIAMIRQKGIEGIVAIGGDGTFRGALDLIAESDIKIVGCPGTIDNDLFGTDYTIGYDTAINTALEAIDRIRDTASAMERLFIIEVMGRRAGYIALHVAIAGGAEWVLLPETASDIPAFYERFDHGLKAGKRTNIVVVAEGDETGGAQNVALQLKTKYGIQSRVTVLGHIQRGGSPTARDRLLASKLGCAAVLALRDGRSGVMVGECNGEITYTPFQDTVSKHKPLHPFELSLTDILS